VTDQLAALTAFCVNNAELEQLEAMLAEFNVFEAAGLTSQEIRHSRFLSFLLDPKAACMLVHPMRLASRLSTWS
jgi:hypothetical protein